MSRLCAEDKANVLLVWGSPPEGRRDLWDKAYVLVWGSPPEGGQDLWDKVYVLVWDSPPEGGQDLWDKVYVLVWDSPPEGGQDLWDKAYVLVWGSPPEGGHDLWDKAYVLVWGSPPEGEQDLCTHVSVTCGGSSACWAVVVVTPIMRRAQNLELAREIAFVDSTASCETTRCTVTVVLTATKAGAVLLAVLIHKEQSTNGYLAAFKLLKEAHPLCFGGPTSE
ncbi:hypothetical protein MTO96_050990 [Rhipicephalus appendiculatus]